MNSTKEGPVEIPTEAVFLVSCMMRLNAEPQWGHDLVKWLEDYEVGD